MKRLVIMALLLFIITTAVGQSMKNNLFYGFWPGNIPYVGTSLLNFSSGAPTNLPITTPMGFTMANGFMNDSTGNILFYSNGVFLFNSQNTNIAGCDSICLEDNYYLDTLSIKDGLPISQLFFVIPKPGNNSHFYYMFQLSYNISINSQGPWLNFHLIDMDGDNGRGENVSCNHQVIYDTLTDGFLTSVKHANGRDWWIICNKAFTNLYYKVLVTPDTMIVSSQNIGPPMDSIDYTGQSNFSNDGKWYARADANGGIVIMQFDRCTGQFYNVLHDTISKMGCGGVGFSPNNKRLYVSTWLDLYQYNLEDTINMLANKIKVAHTDSMILPHAPYMNTFYQQFLAADNKIYVVTQANYLAMNVINNPDSLGLACDVIQHGLMLSKLNQRTCPNWPNYELGPEIGSICDSLGLAQYEVITSVGLQLFPNPASGFYNIRYSIPGNATALATVYDVTGKKVEQHNLYGHFSNLQVSTAMYTPGLYVVNVSCNNVSESKRILVE